MDVQYSESIGMKAAEIKALGGKRREEMKGAVNHPYLPGAFLKVFEAIEQFSVADKRKILRAAFLLLEDTHEPGCDKGTTRLD